MGTEEGVIRSYERISGRDVYNNLPYDWTSTNTLFYSMYPASRHWSTQQVKDFRRALFLRLEALEQQDLVEAKRISPSYVEWRKK